MATEQTLIANVELTPDEATNGCNKQITLDGMLAPVDVVIPAGIISGRALTVNAVACTDHTGHICYKTLYVAVWVPNGKKQKRNGVKKIVATILVLLLVIAGASLLLPEQRRDSRFYYGEIQDLEQIVPNLEQRYYLHTLPDHVQDVASILYQTISDFKGQCQLPSGIHYDDFHQLLILMKSECPEIFQLDMINHIKYYYDTDTGYVYSVYFQYQMSKEDYFERISACEQKIAVLLDQTNAMTDAEKELYVFEQLSLNTYYNADGEFADSAYGALIAGEAKCDGISLAMKWCMERMEIDCLCILADPREGEIGHAWNMVRLGEKYYNVDLTASMRYHENDDLVIRNEIVYPLYNISDAWNDADYIVSDAFNRWAEKPTCSTDLNSYYAKKNRFYPANADISAVLFKSLTESLYNGKAISFQFQTEESHLQLQNEMEAIAKRWLYLHAGNKKLNVEWAYFACNVVWVRVVEQ